MKGMVNKTTPVDLSKVLSQHKSGWLALSPDNRTLVAVGKTLKIALERARKLGVKNPSLLKAAPYQNLFVGQ